METKRESELSSLNQRLALTTTLMDKAFDEKLLGKVDDDRVRVYERKKRQWREEEMRLEAALQAGSAPLTRDSVLSAHRF